MDENFMNIPNDDKTRVPFLLLIENLDWKDWSLLVWTTQKKVTKFEDNKGYQYNLQSNFTPLPVLNSHYGIEGYFF